MSPFTEDPKLLIAAGVLIEALLAVALVKSGRAVLIAVMVGVFAIVLAGVVVERMIVTPREEVETTLYTAARQVEHNDVEGVLSHVDPAAADFRAAVRSWLPQIRVHDVAIRSLRIAVNQRKNPPTARADFVGRVHGDFNETGFDQTTVLRQFSVEFRKQGQRWLMTGYQDREPFGAVRYDEEGNRL